MRREVAKLDASGSYREALYLHAQPVSACPREFTFPPLLKACGKLSSDQLRRHKFYIPISSKPGFRPMFTPPRLSPVVA
ncbi:hypothetical protein ACFX13_011619 [Malus domestica]|uniref:Uncharacterized protein n=1 Tax=Malus domestica TaxID=3750 RepID=A0A498I9J2_MALDO|nr:hypothetical protein DVH24_040736 [Malus domestica]